MIRYARLLGYAKRVYTPFIKDKLIARNIRDYCKETALGGAHGIYIRIADREMRNMCSQSASILMLLFGILLVSVALPSASSGTERSQDTTLNRLDIGASMMNTALSSDGPSTPLDQHFSVRSEELVVGDSHSLILAAVGAKNTRSPTDPLCGSSEVISCSVYAKLRGVRDPIRKEYADKFHSACAYHDWCYRYGYATYGRSKEDCDKRFSVQMLDICAQFNWGMLLAPGVSTESCRLAANGFYVAVSTLPAAANAYQKGEVSCEYEGFCPPGKFETTGMLNNCRCPTGHKVHTGIAKETAYCTGAVACPPGRFSTTGRLRGCYCPEGKPKDYELSTGNAYARCKGFDALCPDGKFGTTGKWRGCDCPEGTRKIHLDPTNANAECVKPGSGGAGSRDIIIKGN